MSYNHPYGQSAQQGRDNYRANAPPPIPHKPGAYRQHEVDAVQHPYPLHQQHQSSYIDNEHDYINQPDQYPPQLHHVHSYSYTSEPESLNHHQVEQNHAWRPLPDAPRPLPKPPQYVDAPGLPYPVDQHSYDLNDQVDHTQPYFHHDREIYDSYQPEYISDVYDQGHEGDRYLQPDSGQTYEPDYSEQAPQLHAPPPPVDYAVEPYPTPDTYYGKPLERYDSFTEQDAGYFAHAPKQSSREVNLLDIASPDQLNVTWPVDIPYLAPPTDTEQFSSNKYAASPGEISQYSEAWEPRALPSPGAKRSSMRYIPCMTPWSRSAVFDWLRDGDLHSDRAVIRALRKLVSPLVGTEQVKQLAKDIFRSYVKAGEIIVVDQNNGDIAFVASAAEGIFPSLTQCYFSHDADIPELCGAFSCSFHPPRPFSRVVTFTDQPHDWLKFWQIDSPHATEVQLQYAMHEVVWTETEYLTALRAYDEVFHRTIHTTGVDEAFTDLVFGNIQRILELSKSLEERLAHRQFRQGPYISHIGDIFLEWIERAGDEYVDYATSMRFSERAFRQRSLGDARVQAWLRESEAHPKTNKLSFYSFHGLPTRRLQRYALLLGEVAKRQEDDNTLQLALDRIRSVCRECDLRVAEANRRIGLLDLDENLVWKIGRRDLGLGSPERRVELRGELQRKSESHLEWQMRDVVLLDNFLLCLKLSRDSQLIISRPPIPVDYLVVEDSSEVLYKSSASRLGGTLTRSASLKRRKSITTDDREILYPFIVKHAGRFDKADGEEVLELHADSEEVRRTWIDTIRRVRAQRHERTAAGAPLRVDVLAVLAGDAYTASHGAKIDPPAAQDTAAAAIASSREPVSIMPTPLCTAVTPSGVLIGTENGVYARSDMWRRVIQARQVTQMATLAEFGVVLVLADRMLLAYALADMDRPAQRLSHRDVGFFEVGTSKDRLLVIFKQREAGNSIFRVLEPVRGKRRQDTDFFREFDQFYVPLDCSSLQFLKSTLCIACPRGFETLSLDSKQPVSIPTDGADLRRLADARPLAAYRLQDGQFLLSYDTLAVTLDKFGQLYKGSGAADAGSPLVWQLRARSTVLVAGKYIVASSSEAIEVWRADKRSLRQVITGSQIRLLPGASQPVFAMAHPYLPRRTVVFQLALRD
ncbi:Rho guanine nucleotide exchange factor [Savitreella phatthalungensis]